MRRPSASRHPGPPCSSVYFPEPPRYRRRAVRYVVHDGAVAGDPDRRERHPCGLQWLDGRSCPGAQGKTRESAYPNERDDFPTQVIGYAPGTEPKVVETPALEVEADEVPVAMLTQLTIAVTVTAAAFVFAAVALFEWRLETELADKGYEDVEVIPHVSRAVVHRHLPRERTAVLITHLPYPKRTSLPANGPAGFLRASSLGLLSGMVGLTVMGNVAWAEGSAPGGRPASDMPEELSAVAVDPNTSDAQVDLGLQFQDHTGKTVVLGDLVTGDIPTLLTLNYYMRDPLFAPAQCSAGRPEGVDWGPGRRVPRDHGQH